MQVLYEMLARTMLIFSELPPGSTDPAVADQYAAKVCRGYRPARPLRMAQAPWQLITECLSLIPLCICRRIERGVFRGVYDL